MNITILLASIRPERQSHRLAFYLQDQITKAGNGPVNLIDLRDYPLPVFGYLLTDQDKKNKETISTFFKESHAVIFVTPEYHGNIPAALKNILEYCGMDLIGKTIGIASTSATKTGGLNASNALQITLSNLSVYHVPRRLLVPEIHSAFTMDNNPANDEVKEPIEKFLDVLLDYTASLEKMRLS